MNLNIYNRLAEHLTRECGVATLRYDKRGSGASQVDGDTSAFYKAGLWDFAHDALGAYAFLANHPAIDPSRIFILGHSEGCTVIPAMHSLLTNQTTLSPPCGVLFISGVAEPLPDATARQRRLLWDEVSTLTGIKGFLLRRILTKEKLESDAKKTVDDALTTKEDMKSALFGLSKVPLKWYREHWLYAGYTSFAGPPNSPSLLQTHLSQITSPVFALTGSKDVQIDPDCCNVGRAKEWMPKARSVDCKVVDGVSHILRRQKGDVGLVDLMKEYKEQAERDLDEEVVQAICGWVSEVIQEGSDGRGELNEMM
ncbi:hypothetical protein HDV00_000482 [Rhizophlyctis rosea]|nr:hypothetical protein HDV00_000482 [Rhizophlyctis rosea]